MCSGLGGHPWLYEIHNCDVQIGSQFRYNSYHGLLLGLLTNNTAEGTASVDLCFYSIEDGGSLVDQFTLDTNLTAPAVEPSDRVALAGQDRRAFVGGSPLAYGYLSGAYRSDTDHPSLRRLLKDGRP